MAIKALVFDTYGTVVDWRTSVLTELEAFGTARRLSVEWTQFLADWKSCYRRGLDEALHRYALRDLDEAERARLTQAWWRLRPWPDAVAGLTRLRARYVISPLSNASFAGMVHLARFACLPWDCIITAENAGCYKPRPEVYQTAVRLLGLAPADIMMVAAHNYDLRAAQQQGLRTAFVPRPTEYGPGQTSDLAPVPLVLASTVGGGLQAARDRSGVRAEPDRRTAGDAVPASRPPHS